MQVGVLAEVDNKQLVSCMSMSCMQLCRSKSKLVKGVGIVLFAYKMVLQQRWTSNWCCCISV